MSGYLRSITVKTKFDGDDVTVVLAPLQMSDAVKLRSVATGDGAAISAAFSDILSRQLVSIDGLKDAGGNAVSKDEFLGSAYFARLVTEVGSELFRHATPANPTQPAP
jgi:hypothetical protein